MEQKIVIRLKRINKIIYVGEFCDISGIQKDGRDDGKSRGSTDRNMKLL